MLSSTPAKLPPENYRRIIQEMLIILPDPVDKLNLLNRVLADFWQIPSSYRIYPRWAEITLRKMVLDQAENIRPGSRKMAQKLMKEGLISKPRPYLWKVYQMRHVIISTLALFLVWGMGSAVAAFFDIIQPGLENETVLARPARIKIPVPPIPGNHEPEIPAIGAKSLITAVMPQTTSKLDNRKTEHAGQKAVSKVSGENPKPSNVVLSFLKSPEPEICSATGQTPFGLETETPTRPGWKKGGRVSVPNANLANKSPATTTSEPITVKDSTSKETEQKLVLPAYLEKPIWLVEDSGNTEIYSNRLHIITTHTVDNIPRSYLDFPRFAKNEEKKIKTAKKIMGILYHASESDIFPFNPEMSASIKKHSAALIRFLKQQKSYHYFIDRFGRVYRIVRDDHAAFHAGRSIWADETSFYLNLNHAFIGICFEGRDFETVESASPEPKDTHTGPKMIIMENSTINDAQLRSGKELTDWLRVKYRIHEHNCVPHGLVSINRHRKLIGHHLDLSHNFPFKRFGLSDKYLSPLPSIIDFGFTFDRYFLQIFKGKPWPGVNYSMDILKQRATAQKVELAAFQKNLQAKFDSYYAMEEDLQERNEALAIKRKNPSFTKTARNN